MANTQPPGDMTARTRKLGIEGPQAQFHSAFLLDHITAASIKKKMHRWEYLSFILKKAGFTDTPSKWTALKWHSRGYIPDVWLPTVLYAVLVSGARVTFADLLKVDEKQP